ncbi:uncharacterized protein LOC120196981 [Hibiscus syriacus]|uniref:uncharacterized protein LOC120196981 n=1 Tax=Hibiscus syriacus TaxID=106335 RepID=UPI001924C4A8|nr:uncharacterized protein LOC120196981 [Hibiscus syriacus]
MRTGFLLPRCCFSLVFASSCFSVFVNLVFRMDSGSTSLDWKKLFVGSKEQSLDFFPPELRDGVATVIPPPEVIDEGIADWNNALIGQFLGPAPSFGSMQRIIETIWGNSSQVKGIM